MIFGIISAIIGLIGTVIGATVNSVSTKKTNEANLQLYEKQLSDQKAQWEATNAYNAPAAQIQRYKEAGINPLLVAGSAGNTATTPQVPNIPRFEAPQWGAAFQGMQTGYEDMMRGLETMQQIRESKSRQELNDANRKLAQSKEAYNILRNDAFGKGDYFGTYVQQQKQKLMASIYGNAISDLNYRFLRDTFDTRKNALQYANDLTQAKTNTEKSRKGLFDNQANYWKWKGKDQEQSYYFNYDTYNWRKKIVSETMENLGFEGDLKLAQTNYYNARTAYTWRKHEYIPIDVLTKVVPWKF